MSLEYLTNSYSPAERWREDMERQRREKDRPIQPTIDIPYGDDSYGDYKINNPPSEEKRGYEIIPLLDPDEE